MTNIANLLAGRPSFTKKQADLFFPPDFADDFPVAMQVLKLLVFVVHFINSVNIWFLFLFFGRYPTNTIWFMWLRNLAYYLSMIWRQLLLYIGTESVQILYFWPQKLHLWEAFMPSTGEARFYWLLLMNKPLWILSVAKYVSDHVITFLL